jgi:hypothetical protein
MPPGSSGTSIGTTGGSSTVTATVSLGPPSGSTVSFAANNEGSSTVATISDCVGGNPIPAIGTLSPSSVGVGSGSFTLTVYGTGFGAFSTILWNGSSAGLTTSYSSSTPNQLSTTIPSSFLTVGGTAMVTVSNSTPGGGTSSGIGFAIGGSSLGLLTAQTANGVASAPNSNGVATLLSPVPIVLSLNSGVSVSALIFGVRLIPVGNAPTITVGGPFFQVSAALAGDSSPFVGSTSTDIEVFFPSFSPSLSSRYLRQ